MRIAVVQNILMILALTSCKNASTAELQGARQGDIVSHPIAFEHEIERSFEHILNGQRLCLVVLKQEGTMGPDYLLFTPERALSERLNIPKGCTQERDSRSIPARLKLPLWKGQSFEIGTSNSFESFFGIQSSHAFQNLQGYVNGRLVQVGVLGQSRTLHNNGTQSSGALKLLALCQHGSFRNEVYSQHCKLEYMHPYHNPKAQSLKLVAPR